jgi:hypothetical protein
MKIYKYILIYVLLLLLSTNSQSLSPIFFTSNTFKKESIIDLDHKDFTYKSTIKSVRFHKKNWELSYPILDLKDQLSLILSFDDLGDQPETYSYTLVHCDHLWEPSQILKSDYIDGLQEEIIQDYEFSRNTHQNYVHYSLELPNEDMQFKLSGNYILKVFQNYDQDDLVLTRRFLVVDSKVKIEGGASRSNNLDFFHSHQEVDFKILHPNLRLDNPLYNIDVVLVQNFDWSTAIKDLEPAFMATGELIYDYEEGNLFQGLSEFRHFDIKNLNYITEGIERIQFERPLNNVYLLPDESRSASSYYFEKDINGKYLVSYHLEFDPATGADYVMTHFRLPFEAPITAGSLYVYGALSDWSFSPEFEMSYNYEMKEYELAVLLKQGYYNYQYRFIPETGYQDPGFIEGSFYETENDYHIFVYFKDYSSRYEQLIGFKTLNSVNKNDD